MQPNLKPIYNEIIAILKYIDKGREHIGHVCRSQGNFDESDILEALKTIEYDTIHKYDAFFTVQKELDVIKEKYNNLEFSLDDKDMEIINLRKEIRELKDQEEIVVKLEKILY